METRNRDRMEGGAATRTQNPPPPAQTTRDQIIAAADDLFYRQGFDHTSFAHVAEAVRISRGNFYYHFKTKDEILDAVIAHRVNKTRAMLDQWQREGCDPVARIGCFVRILIANQADILRHGCPVGTLTTELAKLDHDALPGANRLFTLFRDWLREQFVQLGLSDEADDLSLHLLARSQGVATLANAFHDEEFIRREVDEMIHWVETRIQSTK